MLLDLAIKVSRVGQSPCTFCLCILTEAVRTKSGNVKTCMNSTEVAKTFIVHVCTFDRNMSPRAHFSPRFNFRYLHFKWSNPWPNMTVDNGNQRQTVFSISVYFFSHAFYWTNITVTQGCRRQTLRSCFECLCPLDSPLHISFSWCVT